ncbi:MAG: 4'-phosphopantetheinyl transferase superfamily protein [Bacteroidota bacterium]
MNTDVMARSEDRAVVWAIENKRRLRLDEWENLSRRIPERLLQPILQFQRWEDRQASLFGKLLLQAALSAMGEARDLICALDWDQYKRPYLPGNIDFNIAHTDGFVLCALQKNGRIGIDAEAIKPVFIPDYKAVFTKTEYVKLLTAPNETLLFFELWTKKEAVMKADGKGFYLDPKSISVDSDRIILGDNQWIISSLQVHESLVCNVALTHELPIDLNWFTLETLLSDAFQVTDERFYDYMKNEC